MMTKYQNNFEALAASEAALLAQAISARHPQIVFGDSPTGMDVYSACSAAGMTQADVVMTMARDTTPEGVVVLEKLVGRPIVRVAPPQPERAPRKVREPGAPRASVSRTDPRVISEVKPNPKKPGSASHTRYALYQEGMTVSDFLKAGGTMADVNWDVERGFIKLGGVE